MFLIKERIRNLLRSTLKRNFVVFVSKLNMPLEPTLVDGILIRSMTVDDYKEVEELLGRSFYNYEPLSMISSKDMQKEFEDVQDALHISMIEQDTSIVAIDESNHIVGVALARAHVPEDLEISRLVGDKYGGTYKFMSIVQNKANIFKHYGVSKALLSYHTTVEVSMRGKGLGSRLAATLMDVGRSKGFPLMTANCTSFYSARQKQALGMECIYSLAYADYKNDQGEVLFKLLPPHTHVRVLAIKL